MGKSFLITDSFEEKKEKGIYEKFVVIVLLGNSVGKPHTVIPISKFLLFNKLDYVDIFVQEHVA